MLCTLSTGDNRENEYLRFGRENTNGYIRFGRNDPFLRFGKKNDPFLRFGKQDPFLRFGRQDPFLRFGKQDPFLRIGKQDPFLRIGREDPFLRFGRNDPYLRFGRNDPYLRFGRNDPYLRFGKSDPFLRFGKSVDSELESGVDAITLSREHEFGQEASAGDRRKRSVQAAQVDKESSQIPMIREAREASNSDRQSNVNKLDDELAARDIRNGQYMRFGKKSYVDVDDSYDDELYRILRNYDNTIALPRFGKRGEHVAERNQEYMRFGREASGI